MLNKFFIVNEVDRPFEKHVAEMRGDGLLYYIHPDLQDIDTFHGTCAQDATPLEQFGIVVEIDRGVFSGRQMRGSSATYSDGKPRRWQGAPIFSFPYGNSKKILRELQEDPARAPIP